MTMSLALNNQVLSLVKNKLIEMGYLTDDGSMKICSTIATVPTLHPGECFIASISVNDDYVIAVRIEINNIYSRVLHCGLQIVTDYMIQLRYTDEIFDIEF